MPRIVILGADGFIGRHLTKRLAALSTNKITAFDRFSSYQISGTHPFDSLPNVTIAIGNFFNRNELYEVLYNADYVFHLISTTNPATSNSEPLIDVETNIKNSVELFDLCQELGVKKIVFLSSGGTVYGDVNSAKITEETIPRPKSPYGIGKLAIENYLRYFKQRTGLDYIIYRVANPYGPGQNIHGKQGVIPVFLHHYLTHEPITIYGDGDMVRDYVYIEDLVEMIACSYRKKNIHCEYNLGSGVGHSVNELIRFIENHLGYTVIKSHEDTPETFTHTSVLDISRFIKEFKYRPKTSLQEGIQKTLEYVQTIE